MPAVFGKKALEACTHSESTKGMGGERSSRRRRRKLPPDPAGPCARGADLAPASPWWRAQQTAGGLPGTGTFMPLCLPSGVRREPTLGAPQTLTEK